MRNGTVDNQAEFGHNQPLAVVPEISTERPFAPHRPGVV
jgi:hypothetical protein